MTTRPPRPTAHFVCVSEDTPRWHRKVENWALSIRRFAGSLREAPATVSFVEHADAEVVRRLADLDVHSVVVDRSTFPPPPTNKLRMLELALDADVIIATDCDVVVMGDIGDWLSRKHIRAMREHTNPLPDWVWYQLSEVAGLQPPEKSMTTTHTGELSFPYFNSGVLMIPAAEQEALLRRWAQLCQEFWRLTEGRDDVLRQFSDQIAFSTAVRTDDVSSVEPLPVALNLFTTVPMHDSVRRELHPPYVLHYRNEIDDHGFLFESPYCEINSTLHALNCARADWSGASYESLPKVPSERAMSRRLGSMSWFRSEPVTKVRGSTPYQATARALRSGLRRLRS